MEVRRWQCNGFTVIYVAVTQPLDCIRHCVALCSTLMSKLIVCIQEAGREKVKGNASDSCLNPL